MTWATLYLRVRGGTVPVRVRWTGSRTKATALAVRFHDPSGHDPPDHRPQPDGTVVLVARPSTVEDAIEITEWAADHASEFITDSGRLLVGGVGGGAAMAAAVVRHAAQYGWPTLTRETL
ncbi:alpha/beta hydrolase fold domain-containing protein [Nonomuraea soli]|uniref:Alpha/beta hydrolase fold-3 domain-containing protein n=1 Tax=Nonomuraea soli TaxID=1032476 RepID=A0A7W0CII8_9ACTN|nr:alpha/beta hydrolase fold domain-containing protein [Nonomuraea soli]MBA2891780.1 hypothetical protein [Nonomuraea soli]